MDGKSVDINEDLLEICKLTNTILQMKDAGIEFKAM